MKRNEMSHDLQHLIKLVGSYGVYYCRMVVAALAS